MLRECVSSRRVCSIQLMLTSANWGQTHALSSDPPALRTSSGCTPKLRLRKRRMLWLRPLHLLSKSSSMVLLLSNDLQSLPKRRHKMQAEPAYAERHVPNWITVSYFLTHPSSRQILIARAILTYIFGIFRTSLAPQAVADSLPNFAAIQVFNAVDPTCPAPPTDSGKLSAKLVADQVLLLLLSISINFQLNDR